MKTKIFRLLLLTLMFCYSDGYSFGQIQFKSPTLRLFEGIAFSTTYDNVIATLKTANFNLQSKHMTVSEVKEIEK